MLQLINNLTMLTTFLFFTNLLLNWIKANLTRYESVYPFIAGLMHGLLGISLMLLSVAAPGGFHLDLRALAIISAVYMAGRKAGLIALVFILTGRFVLVDISNIAGVITGTSMVTLAYGLSAWLLRHTYRKSFTRWMIVIGGSMIVPCIVLYFVQPDSDLHVYLIVMGIYYIGGIFTYLLLTYLSQSNRSLYLLREKASRDHLTGLYNPRAFEGLFENKTAEASRNKESFSLLMIDIDHFKSINDTYGHIAGDTVLAGFGELLHHFVRSSDYCARKGGEEFVVLLNHALLDQAEQKAEELRQRIAQHPFILADGTILNITASIGVATFPMSRAELLLEHADQALYRAKHQGRNRVCSF